MKLKRATMFMKASSWSIVTCMVGCLLLSLTFSKPIEAASYVYYNDYAVKLAEVGVFKGTGTGYELDREPTRLEGLIMLIRLLGKESEANLLTSEGSIFRDVPDWGRGYVNYAYQNKLTIGIGDRLFGTNDKMNGKSYVTFLLRSVGYTDIGTTNDFTWSQSVEFAKKIGLLDEDLYFKMVSNTFTRDYVAKSSFNTLNQKLKGSDTTLVQTLVSSGVITTNQLEKLNAPIIPSASPNGNMNTGLTSQEIGKLADAVVYIEVTNYDGSGSTGSGFYVSSDGNIVTNYHVIEGAKSLKIVENDGQVYTGNVKVIGYDMEQDMATIDIDRTVKLYLRTGNSDTAQLGEEIYTIGSPKGLRNTLSNGIISSFREGFIQISAPISPGSSGGVLLNKQGIAIGITTAIIQDGANLGFAIPINAWIKMPKNVQLTLAQLSLSTSTKPMTYEQYGKGILSKYGKLSVGGETAYFSGINISLNEYATNSINVFLYVDPTSFTPFLTIASLKPLEIEKFFATVCSEIGRYYNKDVTGYILYSDSYSMYPSSFVKNNLYSDAVQYNERTGSWDVFYPFVFVDLKIKTNTYNAKWAF